jgi:hypothetical protein
VYFNIPLLRLDHVKQYIYMFKNVDVKDKNKWIYELIIILAWEVYD